MGDFGDGSYHSHVDGIDDGVGQETTRNGSFLVAAEPHLVDGSIGLVDSSPPELLDGGVAVEIPRFVAQVSNTKGPLMEAIWDFAKFIGVTYVGGDEEVFRMIDDLLCPSFSGEGPHWWSMKFLSWNVRGLNAFPKRKMLASTIRGP